MTKDVSKVFQALSDATRMKILQLIAERELPAGQIAGHFPVTRTAISQHLSLLKDSGLIDERREGTKRIYRPRPDGLSEARAVLASIAGPGAEKLNVATAIADMQPPPVPIEKRLVNEGELKLEVTILARMEQVYALLTKASGLSRWFARQVETEARPGGMFRLANRSGVSIQGEYHDVSPPDRVSFSWGGIDGLAIGESEVRIQLEREGEGTRLNLWHGNLPGKMVPNYRNLWHHSALPKLKQAAEGRDPSAVVLEPPA